MVSSYFEILPEQATGNPDTLKEFISWANEKAPAENQLLSINGHSRDFIKLQVMMEILKTVVLFY